MHHDIAFMPLDLPRFEGQEEIRTSFDPSYTSSIWAQSHLVPSYTKDGLPYDSPREWLPEALERFPTLIRYVEEHLPFRRVVNAKVLKSSDSTLGIHVDIGKYDWPGYAFYKHQYLNTPAAYRIILDGEGERILYYTDGPDTPREHWRWARLPSNTNTFIHSATDSLHGAEYYPGLNRYILFIHGWLDVDRHNAILARSAQAHADYVIRFSDLRVHRCST
jgi:hypothetical protein